MGNKEIVILSLLLWAFIFFRRSNLMFTLRVINDSDFVAIHEDHEHQRPKKISLADPTYPDVPPHYPRLILGHSTGHSASYSVHRAISEEGCPWRRRGVQKAIPHDDDPWMMSNFERTAPGEKRWHHGNLNSSSTIQPSCQLVQDKFLPYLFRLIVEKRLPQHDDADDLSNIIYLDMGHFHNRGHLIECLAKIFQHKLTLIRIRRNRHQIANSFASKFMTPCLLDTHDAIANASDANRRNRRISPGSATCPRSGEQIGPVHLPIPGGDEMWDSFTSFQKFLWYVDEMEYRWYILRRYFQETSSLPRLSPTFLEVSWSSAHQLMDGIHQVRTSLGCTTNGISDVAVTHNHTKWQESAELNCTDYIVQDLNYQRMMQYDATTLQIILSSSLPLHLDNDKCVESRKELEHIMLSKFASAKTVDERGRPIPLQ
jgi:hypothetical protein